MAAPPARVDPRAAAAAQAAEVAALTARRDALKPLAVALMKNAPCLEGVVNGHHGSEKVLYFRGELVCRPGPRPPPPPHPPPRR
jgi:hypothetical protein